jgi:hypothetical protein
VLNKVEEGLISSEEAEECIGMEFNPVRPQLSPRRKVPAAIWIIIASFKQPSKRAQQSTR